MESTRPVHPATKLNLMKKQVQLSIQNPCSENWNSFTSTGSGAFCSSCKTNVVDFTKMSDSEVIAFLKEAKGHTCGRLRTDQMKTYTLAQPHSFSIRPSRTLLRIGLISFMFVMADNLVFAQRREPDQKEVAPTQKTPATKNAKQIVRGTVYEPDTNVPLPGANVLLVGTTLGTTTDENGKFEFPWELKNGDQLVFSFIGYDPYTYTVNNVTAPIEIRLTTEYMLMGAIAVDDAYVPQKEKRSIVASVKSWFK